MSHARIYQKPKSSMQSGTARTSVWILEFEPREAQCADPLTGWAGSGDTRRQISLSFPTLAAAEQYAQDKGIIVHIIPPPERRLKLQAYADNFR